ncbi:MAG TPA: hypothetical protein ENN80_11550 [Candidatus Hydrogenedentes bacterium]|nr:hypothetical protein [Candidatus Hydrogenedentota bacterium]
MSEALALDGGQAVRTEPWPPRRLFTEDEKRAAEALFDRCIASGNAFWYDGEEDQAYCREFAAFLGGGYADAVNSGTAAVYVALRALDIEPFTEIIAPPVTDMGGVMPIPLINCIPIPADTAPNSYNMGPEQIEAAMTERTRAIVVAHIAGIPADMDPIMELARAKGIPVVEDCAQAHGAMYKGRYVGTIGDVAAFSTMSGKHHATGGQGGVVFTKREDLYWKVRRASDRGKAFNVDNSHGNVACSLNLNLDDLSACIGRVQLRKLPHIVAGCQRVAQAIDERCGDLEAVRTIMPPADCKGAFWFFVFRLDLEKIAVDLETFVRALQEEGLPFAGHYTEPFTEHDWYRNRAVFGSSGYPWTSPLYKGDADATFALPNFEAVDHSFFRIKVHENCGEREAEDVQKALKKVEGAYAG